MRLKFDIKLIFLSIFFLLAIAIKKSENFQLRDPSDGVGSVELGSSRNVFIKHTPSGSKYTFRKLEKLVSLTDETDSENDDEDDDDSEENSEIKFEKVRKPTFEVKKRTNLRPSKLAQFREKTESDESGDEEKESFFSKIKNFFKRKPQEVHEKESEEENDDVSAELEDDSSGDSENIEKKPLIVEFYEKFQEFLAQRKEVASTEPVEDDDDSNEIQESNNEVSGDEDDDETESEPSSKLKESSLKMSFKKTFKNIFNRAPFNLIINFSDESDEDSSNFEDSEEDEINYQKLLAEEREKLEEHTEQLSSTEEILPKTQEHEMETAKSELEKQPAEEEISPSVKKEKKSKQELHLARKEFEKLLLNLPSFVPDYSKVKNPECQKQGEVFQRQLRGQRLWALQMMDATAKIPSGLLRGNTNQLGDFDLCTKISQKIKISETNVMKMKGKYCLANIDVVAAADQLKLPVHLMQGRNFLRSTINDPNHFFPRYSTINWGLCLPSACTFNDADNILESFIGPYNSSGLKLHINVNEDSCYVRKNVDISNLIKSDWKIFGTCIIIIAIAGATALATLNDYWDSPVINSLLNAKLNQESSEEKSTEQKSTEEKSKDTKTGFLNNILMCFSAKKNIATLLGFVDKEDEIKCLHGLKAISITLLFASLKLVPMGRVPYTNRNKLTEFFNSPLSVFFRSSFLYGDVFLIISGFLATLSILKSLNSSGKISWFRKIIARYLRLVPQLAIVLLFYAYIWDHLGTGPQWSAVVSKNAELCQTNFWKNLLFIQNVYPLEDMCATHTYLLAINFQLFILTPLLIWFIYKHPCYGLGLYGILHAFSAAARFTTTVDNRLSVVVFHGMKLSQLYRTFNLSLAVSLHRGTPYLVGIALGIMICEFERVKLSKGAVISGWISSLVCIIWCFYTPSNLSHKDYQYDPVSAAQYSALAPLLWSLAIAWVIFACHTDHSWKLNCILSSKPMIFLSNISYSIYLIQFLVLFYFSGTLKSSEEFHLSSYLDRLEMLIVIVSATIFALIVDFPMQNIKNIILLATVKVDDSSKPNTDESAEFESPFTNDEDDFMFRPLKFKYDANIDNQFEENHQNVENNKQDLIGDEDEDPTDEEMEIEEEEMIDEPNKLSKAEPAAMNARRWKWEVLDD